jgi:hypothetical protein
LGQKFFAESEQEEKRDGVQYHKEKVNHSELVKDRQYDVEAEHDDGESVDLFFLFVDQ